MKRIIIVALSLLVLPFLAVFGASSGFTTQSAPRAVPVNLLNPESTHPQGLFATPVEADPELGEREAATANYAPLADVSKKKKPPKKPAPAKPASKKSSAPQLAAGPHAFIFGKEVARWNPCAVVEYKVNWRRSPPGAQKDLTEAFHRITLASGLKFKYIGTTSSIPGKTPSKDNEVVIAWAKTSESSLLKKEYSAVAGPTWTIASNEGPTILVAGDAVFNADQNNSYRPGFGPGMSRGNLFLHELGHLVGLGHVNNSTQIMNPFLSKDTRDGYQKGDLTGLKILGQGPCLTFD